MLLRYCFMFLILLLAGCGTSRIYDYPYAEVTPIIKDKFIVRHDAFATTLPVVEESEKSFSFSFYSDIDFYFSVGVDISVEAVEEKKSKVTVKIIEYYKSWSYQSRDKKMEKAFLDILAERLKSGKWNPLPWQDKDKLNKSILDAIFKNIKDIDEQ